MKDFEQFRKAAGLHQKDSKSQGNTLIYSMCKEADDIIMSFRLITEEANQNNVVKDKLEAHFVVKRNKVFERAKFNLRSQQNGGSVKQIMEAQEEDPV